MYLHMTLCFWITKKLKYKAFDFQTTHQVQESLCAAYALNSIDFEELMNAPSNRDFQYHGYQFNLDNLNNDR